MRCVRQRGGNGGALRNILRGILALPAPEIYTTEYCESNVLFTAKAANVTNLEGILDTAYYRNRLRELA